MAPDGCEDISLPPCLELRVLAALQDTLRWAAAPRAIRSLFDRCRQHYMAPGSGGLREFGMHYSELQAAVAAGDVDWAKEVLRNSFRLQL